MWIQTGVAQHTGWVGTCYHHTHPALVVLYSTFRIGLHGSGFFPSLGCFPNGGQMAKMYFGFVHMLLNTHRHAVMPVKFEGLLCISKNIPGFFSTSLCVCNIFTYTAHTHNCVYTTVPTVWCDDLCRLGWSSYIPCGQSAIRVAANKLFTLMVPGD